MKLYDSKVYGKIRDNIDEEDTIHTFNKYQYVSAGERILSLKSSNFLVYTEDEELNKIRNRFQLKTKSARKRLMKIWLMRCNIWMLMITE